MFSTLIVAYLFLGGCGGGVMLAMSAWSLLFHRGRGRTRDETLVFNDLMGKAYATGFVVICLSALCLLLDLGRPERALLLFLRPTDSLITVGAFALAACVALSAFLAFADLLSGGRVPSVAKKVAEALCTCASLVLIAYTGLFLWNLDAVPLWSTPSLPVLFVASSISAGLSAVFLIAAVVHDFSLLEPRIRRVHLAHLVVVAVEVASFACFLAAAAMNRSASESLALLFSRDMFFWTVGGLAVLGLATPLAAEVAMLASKRAYHAFPADMACVVGSFCLRYCVVMAGLH